MKDALIVGTFLLILSFVLQSTGNGDGMNFGAAVSFWIAALLIIGGLITSFRRASGDDAELNDDASRRD